MNYTLVIHPEVGNDALLAYNWYEAKSLGLGEEFLRVFYSCISEIENQPLIFQKVEGECRRNLLRRFPYCVYYIIKKDQVIILGLFHSARDPRKITKFLKQRT
ncbi:MAG: type II toxin-antitoxin system RelE/ParE family toxin [Promethearchaeota archaeon]